MFVPCASYMKLQSAFHVATVCFRFCVGHFEVLGTCFSILQSALKMNLGVVAVFFECSPLVDHCPYRKTSDFRFFWRTL